MHKNISGWDTAISQLLQVKYPFVQAPMYGVTTTEMVVAAANAGCLGSLALGDLPYDECVELIRAVKQQTGKRFAANIFVYDIPGLTDTLKEKYREVKIHIEKLASAHQLEVTLPEIEQIKINSYQEQVDALIAEDCSILSFTFGCPDAQSIARLKDRGILLIGTCTSVDEALVLERSGIDIICVQGLEAGGHRGSFTTGDDMPRIGGMTLLPQVYERVGVPLIYAGGIYNAGTIAAARALGAQGFQVGSILLGSAESALADFEKQQLKDLTEKDIVLTKSFSGRYARGISNAFIKAMDHTPYILPYPYQNKLTGELRKAAKAKGNADFVSIWVGQSINRYSDESTGDILTQLITAATNGAA